MINAQAGGLKSAISNNEKIKPNSDLLNTLKITLPQFFEKDIVDEEGNFIELGAFKSEKFLEEIKENNIAESKDGYKLGFVGKDYARLQTGRASETVIVPDHKHNALSENKDSGNVFITGDNIDALRHLVNAYENRIKLIYIDPPYNTGKEFVYSDKFEFNDEKLSSALGYNEKEIERLKSIQGKSSHSAWLTFMYPRLKIAQKLLTLDGVIFISIDDNEQANLKLLMDDVFGEGNFVSEVIWKNKFGSGAMTSGFIGVHEYIFVYSKNTITNITRSLIDNERDTYNKTRDEKFPTRGGYVTQPLAVTTFGDRPNLRYPVQYKGQEIWPDDGFTFDTPVEKLNFSGYSAHLVQSKLYLIAPEWGAKQTKDLLNRIGKNELNVQHIVVYAYSFLMESLRELEINIKNTLDADHQVYIERRY
ncbi:hypothetical protein FACS1894137_00350 [Spirochaetia bacterium]|nr:hypothetical protein FACS1894137_00350 [Spirochaetia bacterium]